MPPTPPAAVAVADPGADLRHRVRETTLSVVGPDGAPLPHAEVTVEQV
ncbi:MAG: hypothetical protein H5T83_13575, partial [Actinotalea sp.]|nr:hypothetical protein [Actinotalea sp.]